MAFVIFPLKRTGVTVRERESERERVFGILFLYSNQSTLVKLYFCSYKNFLRPVYLSLFRDFFKLGAKE